MAPRAARYGKKHVLIIFTYCNMSDMIHDYRSAPDSFLENLESKICSPEHLCSTTEVHYNAGLSLIFLLSNNSGFCYLDILLGQILIIFRLTLQPLWHEWIEQNLVLTTIKPSSVFGFITG